MTTTNNGPTAKKPNTSNNNSNNPIFVKTVTPIGTGEQLSALQQLRALSNQQQQQQQQQQSNTNLLMSAAPRSVTLATGAACMSSATSSSHSDDGLGVGDDDEEDDLAALALVANGDGDVESDEIKQRKKELIIAKQIERRHKLELVRQQREEERARKADELRERDEEAANKKLVDKRRKEIIYQAYMDKKRQDECQLGGAGPASFGLPASSASSAALSLLNNKQRFYSTHRLPKTINNNIITNQSANGVDFGGDHMSSMSNAFAQNTPQVVTSSGNAGTLKSKLTSYIFWFHFIYFF